MELNHKHFSDPMISGKYFQSINNNSISNGIKQKHCKYKRKYTTIAESNSALTSYRSQVIFTTMTIYRCNKHACYHLGHSRNITNEIIVNREKHDIL